MVKETTTEVEENVFRHKFLDQNSIVYEYENIVACLKEELNNCKSEQLNLRTEIEALQKDNQNAADIIKRTFAECNCNNCEGTAKDEEAIMNLEKRITILQMEKDSVFQLWQMALKAIDILEEELKTVHRDDKSNKFYQEQINSIKETYSEAIKVLEAKLGTAKETFFQQQTVSEKSKEKIDQLTKERNEIIEKLNILQQQSLEKEKTYQTNLDFVTEDLNRTKKELEKISRIKIDLEEQLRNAQKFSSTSMIKVAEAVGLVESAMKEKEEALNRESRVVAEKTKLETSFSKLSEEYISRLESEVSKAKEIYEKNVKEYIIEIKGLKAKLREQVTLLDRSQRECRLKEEELDRVRHESDNLTLRLNTKIANLEQSMHENHLRLQTAESNHKSVYDDKINDLEHQVSLLQERLLHTSEKLKRVQLQSSRDVKDQVRESDDRTREILERCLSFEKQLSLANIDKENLTFNLHTLKLSFEKEMQKRNHENILLENKVQDLQEKIINAEKFVNEARTFSDNMSNKRHIGQQTLMNVDSISNILSLQEKYEKKTKELTQHVETHQKLSNKWKEEANLLANKFQKRSQELKNKISALQKQNEELTKELLFYQQILARCNSQMVQNFNSHTDHTENR